MKKTKPGRRAWRRRKSRDPRRHVFRYDEHMPRTDDVSLIVLKGHLLVEEMLGELAGLVLANPRFLDDARLSFHQLARVVRSATPVGSRHNGWDLVFALNSLRNDLAHNLESRRVRRRLRDLFAVSEKVQPVAGMKMDKSQDAKLEPCERLRHCVVDCMQFLRGIIFVVEKRKGRPSTINGS